MSFAAISQRILAPPTLLVGAVLVLAPLFGWALANEAWPLVMVFGAAALAPVVIRWPVVSTLGLYAFLLPFDMVAGFGGGATLTRLLGMAAGGVLLVTGLMERRLVRPPVAALFLGALVLWAAATSAWALDPDMVFSRVRTAVSLFVLYLVAVSLKVSHREMGWLCALTVAGGAVSAGAAYFLGIDDSELRGRATLTVADRAANSNAFAAALLLPMGVAIAGVLAARSHLMRIAAVAAVAMIGCGIYISISRAAIVAMVIVVAALVYRAGVRWQMLAVVVVLVLLLGAMPEAFFNRVTAPFTGEDATGSGRTHIWRVGVSALEEFWLFGAGFSNFSLAYARHFTLGPQDFARAPHNTYLGTWVELGLPGLVLLLAAAASHLISAWRLGRGLAAGTIVYALEAACLGMLALAFFGDRLWRKDFWMAFTLLAISVRLVREETSSPPESVAAAADARQPVERRGR